MHIKSITLLLFLAYTLAAPMLTYADAPGTRGRDTSPQGGGTTSWDSVQQLPPPVLLAEPATPMKLPLAQNSGTGWFWGLRQPNVGNWAMDVVLGGAAAMFGSINEAIAQTIIRLTGTSKLELQPSCIDSPLNIIFCTPANLFENTSNAGNGLAGVIQTIWSRLIPLASALIGLMFVIRIGRLALEGTSSLAAEGKEILMAFLITITFIKNAGWLFGRACDLLNGFHTLILGVLISDGRPMTLLDFSMIQPSLNFGGSLALTVFFVVLLILVVKGFIRQVKLVVLIALAPVMGALYFDPATRPRFQAWLGRIGDVMLEQTVWVGFLAIGGLLLRNGLIAAPVDTGEQIIANLAGTIVIGMAVGGESLLAGIAGANTGSIGLAGRLGGAAVNYSRRWMTHSVRPSLRENRPLAPKPPTPPTPESHTRA